MISHARTEGDTATLRYHLTSLYALRPIPDDMVRLIEEIGARIDGTADESD
jgi:hypothetical protein